MAGAPAAASPPPAPTTIDSLFEATVKGKYKLAEGPSTATFWTPRQEKIDVLQPGTTTPTTEDVVGRFVPRPDRTMSVLQGLAIFGFLGLDHFYLRSTKTGLIKLLTLGGLGLWWIWDMLQVFTEGDRVLKYGMTTPFDIYTGIGQGMIANETKYEQRSEWSLWIVSLLFGFMGSEQFFLKQMWVGVRFFLIFAIVAVPLFTFIGIAATQGVQGNYNWFSLFLTLPWLIAFGMIAIYIWLPHFWNVLVKPDQIMETGLETPENARNFLSWWHRLYEDANGDVDPDDQAEYDNLKEVWDPPALLSPDALRKKFWIGHGEAISDGAASTRSGFPLFTLALRPFVMAFNMLPWVRAQKEARRALRLAAAAASGGTVAGLASGVVGAATSTVHVGGARNTEPSLSTESKIIGAVLIALLGGAAVKATVNTLLPE